MHPRKLERGILGITFTSYFLSMVSLTARALYESDMIVDGMGCSGVELAVGADWRASD